MWEWLTENIVQSRGEVLVILFAMLFAGFCAGLAFAALTNWGWRVSVPLLDDEGREVKEWPS